MSFQFQGRGGGRGNRGRGRRGNFNYRKSQTPPNNSGSFPHRGHRNPQMDPSNQSTQPTGQYNWQEWPNLKMKLSGLPTEFRQIEFLHTTLSKYGSISRLDIDGKMQGIAFVMFKPPPKSALWEWQFVKDFAPATVKAELLGYETMKTIASPVRPGVSFPQIISIQSIQLDFGIRRTQACMMKQATILGRSKSKTTRDMKLLSGPGYPTDITISLNLQRELLDIFFPIEVQGRIIQHRLTVRFTHVPKKLFRIDRPDNSCVLIIPLDCPPRFFKKTTAAFDGDSSWNEGRGWERVTDVTRHGDAEYNPIRFRKEGSFIDLGRWICYALTITADTVQSTQFRVLCEALKDWNIEMVCKTEETFIIEKRQECKIWEFLDPQSDGRYDNLSALSTMGLGIKYLSYAVRYQLEVCLSRGLLCEYNITDEFLQKLSEMPESYARQILERAADSRTPYENVMDIFKIPSKRTKEHPPQHCVLARSCTVTPTTIVFSSPSVETSNRVVREYIQYCDRFLRVRFGDEVNLGKIYANSEVRQDEIYKRIKQVFERGIVIGDRKFEFLAFGNSQFRDHSAYFFASLPNLTAANIRAFLGDFTEIRNPSKYCARLGQNFSTTRAIRTMVTVEDCLDDIERNGYTFTDGIGKISNGLCKMIAAEFKLRSPPSVLQFRLGGCKGVLAVWPDVKGFTTIQIRPSQYKFPARHNGLEVIRTSQFVGATLNRQIIILLSSLGVPDKVFVDMERSLLQNLEKAMTDEKTALELLKKNVDFNHSTVVLASMIKGGFMASQEPFVMGVLQLWKTWILKYLKEKARIPVSKGAHLLGCVDELGVLRGWYKDDKPEDLPEVFIKIDSERPGNYVVVEGICVLARNPSLHPGDIRIVRAVNKESLHHLTNVVVLPSIGDRDLGNMCSGGDLDGDDYLVIWDQLLVPKEWNHPAMNFTAEKPLPLDRPVEASDLINFFIQYMKNDQLPAIAHAHLCFADSLIDGPKSDQCLELAELHSRAVDYPKNGIPVKLHRGLRPKKWPHFMEKKKPAEQIYHSKNCLGQLYDLVQREDFTPDLGKPFDHDVLSAYDHSPAMLKAARELKSEYDWAIKRIMAQHGIKTEFEVFSAFVMSHNQEKKDYTFAEELGLLALTVKDKYKEACTEAAGGSGENLMPFIAAMYRVTADEVASYLKQKDTKEGWSMDVPLISFPWIFDWHMIEIKKRGLGKSTPKVLESTEEKEDHPKEESIPILTNQPFVKMELENTMECPESSEVVLPTGSTHRGDYLILFDDATEPGQTLGDESIPNILSQQTDPAPATRTQQSEPFGDTLISFEEDQEPRQGQNLVQNSLLQLINHDEATADLLHDESDDVRLPNNPNVSNGVTLSLITAENMIPEPETLNSVDQSLGGLRIRGIEMSRRSSSDSNLSRGPHTVSSSSQDDALSARVNNTREGTPTNETAPTTPEPEDGPVLIRNGRRTRLWRRMTLIERLRALNSAARGDN